MPFGGYMHSFLLGVPLGVRLLGNRVYNIWLVLVAAAQQFSAIVVPIYAFLSSI